MSWFQALFEAELKSKLWLIVYVGLVLGWRVAEFEVYFSSVTLLNV